MAKRKTATSSKKQSPKKAIKLPRAPVVAVLGHVDHGKTTLLDQIRHTNIQAQETGGITQHIGAYQVEHQGQPITFIDTPGHAAFAKMRERGARVTDLVLLVVAANEGVKPQTKESIRHIKAANVPLIVVINKMDLPGADPTKVKSELVDSDVQVEGFGGKVVTVETIAKTGQGIPELLDMVVLTSELQGLKADREGPLEAVVIESKIDKQAGPLASVIVKRGTLKLNDRIQVGGVTGTVRRLVNDRNQKLETVGPGDPAEILGFKTLPSVGETVTRTGEPVVVKPTPVAAAATPPLATPKTKEETEEEKEEKPRVKAVLKADTQGTLEAIKGNVAEEVETIGEGVGDVGEADVLLAQATGAKILSFRVNVNTSAQKLAELEGIEIKTYGAIYELLEDLEKQVLKLLEPTIDEEVVGTAKITAEFLVKKARIAGCRVTEGKLEVGGQVHLLRDAVIVASAVIRSLKKGKEDVKIAKKDEECGVTFKPSLDFKAGDQVQYYRVLAQ